MDKISSILPSNKRLKSVDLKEAPPARPGAPSLGRTLGSTASIREAALQDRVSLSRRTPEELGKDTLTYKNPKESARAKMVEDISNRFFAKQAPSTFMQEQAETSNLPEQLMSDAEIMDVYENGKPESYDRDSRVVLSAQNPILSEERGVERSIAGIDPIE